MSATLRPDPPLSEIVEGAGSPLSELADLNPVWLWETDADHRFVWLSPNCSRLTGSNPEDYIGRSRVELFKRSSDQTELARRHLDDLAHHRPFNDFVYRHVREDGKAVWLCVGGRPCFDKSGRFTGYQGSTAHVSAMLEFADQSVAGEAAMLQRNAELERRVAARTKAADETTALLSGVLEGMEQGLIVSSLDDMGERRIVLANERASELLEMPPEVLDVGKSADEFIEFCAQRGDFGEAGKADARDRIRRVTEGSTETFVRHLPSGRSVRSHIKSCIDGKHIVTLTDITDLIERKQALESSNELLAEVLEGTEHGLLVVTDGALEQQRIVLSNRRAAEILEFPPEMLAAGAPGKAIVQTSIDRGDFGTDGEDARRHTEVAIQSGKPTNNIRRLKSGRIVKSKGYPRQNGGLIITYSDITEMKVQEEELRRALAVAELSKSVFDRLSTPVLVKNEDLEFVLVNQAFCDLHGVTKEHVIGRSDMDLDLTGGDRAATYTSYDLHVLETGELLDFEEDVTRPDGSILSTYSLKTRVVTESGDRYVVAVITDVSTLKQREADLEAARRGAEAADRAKSEFLANMSHEIRTPMNGILGMGELLKGTNLDSRQRMYADVIVQSGNLLLNIINDILDFSKIAAGQLSLHVEPFQLADVVWDVATLLSTSADDKGLDMPVRVQPDLPRAFVGDPGRIRQILTNLVSNAVKFTDNGHVHIDVSGQVRDDDTARILVKVTDTGIGIAEEHVATIFQKFSQVDGTATRRHEGTGLGLTISKRLVEMMHGEMGVESKPGRGSTFWFALPLPVASDFGPAAQVMQDISGRRVLIVDDNEVNCAILTEQLESWQVTAKAVNSGAKALGELNSAAARGAPFELAILDAQMPEMDGMSVAAAIRHSPMINRVPILMLASVDGPEDRSILDRLQISAHLVKPAKAPTLLAAIAKAIDEPVEPPAEIAAPASTAGEDAEPVEQPSGVAEDDGRSLTARVLIAEDNPVNQMVLQQVLDNWGYDYLIANDGQQAVDLFRKHRPAVVLMDVSMPVLNGLDATRAIREIEGQDGGHTKILGVTAHALNGDKEKCFAVGMDDYVPKPIDWTLLREKLAEALADVEGEEGQPGKMVA